MRTRQFLAFVGLGALACTGTMGDTGGKGDPDNAGKPPKGEQPGGMGDPGPDGTPGVSAPTCKGETLTLPRRLVRLTNGQYERLMGDVLGDPAFRLTTSLPETAKREGYRGHPDTLVAGNEVVVGQFVSAGLEVADALVKDVAGHAKRLGACAEMNETCHVALLKAVATRAFRREPSQAEADRIRAAYMGFAAKADATLAFRYAMAYVLNAPQTLYRAEGAGSWTEARDRMSPNEVADLIAFTLTDGPPDATLAAAARENKLDAAGVGAQVRRLLSGQTPPAGIRAFVSDWLETGALADGLSAAVSKGAPSDLAARLQDQAAATFHALVSDDSATPADLFRSPMMALDKTLATHYRIPCADCGDKLRVMDAGGAGRVGILSQPGYLVAHGTAVKAQPIYRGVHVLRRFLCVDPGDPVGIDIDTAVAEANIPKDADARAFVEKATEPAVCMACHGQFNGIGFVLETFDQAGQMRAPGSPGSPAGESALGPALDARKVRTFEELTQALATSPKAAACTARHLTNFASQFALEEATACDKSAGAPQTIGGLIEEALVRTALAQR